VPIPPAAPALVGIRVIYALTAMAIIIKMILTRTLSNKKITEIATDNVKTETEIILAFRGILFVSSQSLIMGPKVLLFNNQV